MEVSIGESTEPPRLISNHLCLLYSVNQPRLADESKEEFAHGCF